jgi:hypothetical protein
MALKKGSQWSNWSWDKPVKAFIWRSSRICRPIGGLPPGFFEDSLPHLLLRNNSNDYMRTDMLRHVHQYIQARMDQRGKKSPLALLIESIEEVLGVFEGRHRFEGVRPNPFNRDPRYRWSTRGFRPETACHHDITLLQSQRGSLRELCAGLDSL